MIVHLRNNHFKIWILIILILPVAFIYAVLNAPEKRLSEFSRILIEQMPNLIGEVENDELKVSVRANQNNQYQIEIWVKRPIALPSGVFHLLKPDESFTDHTSIGNLNAQGLHRFQVQSRSIW